MIGFFITVPILILLIILLVKFFKREGKYQQEIEKRDRILGELEYKISQAVVTFKAKDYLGAFEADDEVGEFLKNLKEMQEDILEFFKTNVHE